MPSIVISDDSFGALQRLAEPLIDTPDSVIAKLIRHYESTRVKGNGANGPQLPPSVARHGA